MTTPLQRIANRANGSRSTGPATTDGKQTSRANALRHGLTASTLLLDDEDGAVFEDFHQALMDQLAPDGVLEGELAERLISLIWRSRRIARFEAAILDWMGHWSSEYFDLTGYEKDRAGPGDRIQKFHKGLKVRDKTLSPERRKRLAVGRLLHEGMSHNLMAKLSRYEAHILSQLRRTHTELLEEQARPAEALVQLDAVVELDASRKPGEPRPQIRGPAI